MLGDKKKQEIKKVQKALEAWKKKDPEAEVVIEIPGNCISVELCDALIYEGIDGRLVIDVE